MTEVQKLKLLRNDTIFKRNECDILINKINHQILEIQKKCKHVFMFMERVTTEHMLGGTFEVYECKKCEFQKTEWNDGRDE